MIDFLTFKLDCPVCGAELQADELHGARPVGWDTDFRPVYEGPDPLFSHIHTCPRCRYSGYRGAFPHETPEDLVLYGAPVTHPLALAPPEASVPESEELEDLRRWTRSNELVHGLVSPGAEPTGSTSYLLARRVHEFLHDEDPLASAHFTRRAAWCARAEAQEDAEQSALRATLRLLDAALSRDGLTERDETRLTYLAGETARRCGEFGRAVSLLSSMDREATEYDPELAPLAALSRRQLVLATTRVSLNARIPDELAPHAGRTVRTSSFEEEEGGGEEEEDDGGQSSVS